MCNTHLDDFASVGSYVVHAHHTLIVSEVGDDLAEHAVVLTHCNTTGQLFVVHGPLQGLEVRMVHLNVVGTKATGKERNMPLCQHLEETT